MSRDHPIDPTDGQIVDLGERDVAPPGYRRRALPPWLDRVRPRGRGTAGLATVALALALVAASAGGYLNVPAFGPASAATPTTAPYAASASPGTQIPLAISTSTPAYVAHGWPVELPAGDDAGSAILGPLGPDGTISVTGQPPLDLDGHSRTDRLRLFDGTYLTPELFGSDGSAYGYSVDVDGYATIWAFGPDGALRYAYPTGGSVVPAFGVTDSGLMYLLTPSPWANPAPAGTYRVVVLDPEGSPRALWSVGEAWGSTFLLRPDDSFLVGESDVSGCRLHAYSPAGIDVTAGPAPCWDRMAVGPDGTVVAWSYEPGSSGGTGTTTFAVIGATGSAEPGWPVVVPGTASAPVFGTDRSIYVVASRDHGLASLQRLDLSSSGTGEWTAPLRDAPLVAASPLPGGRVVPESPVVGGGTIFVAETDSVEAFEPSGVESPSWPYRLPDGWSNFDCAAGDGSGGIVNPGPVYDPGAGGRLFLALEDRIVGLTPSGGVAAGWPYEPGTGFGCWRGLESSGDGGVIALALYSDGAGRLVVLRLTFDGRVPADAALPAAQPVTRK